MYDILIQNGTVIDGTGETGPKRADVGITNGKIVDIGTLGNARAHRTINAEGHVVAPGFVDIQNHSDSYGALLKNTALESMVHQGITTALVGHCGSSLAPLLSGSLASIQKWSTVKGVNIDWASVEEFFDVMEQRGLGINIATLVGHATLRRDIVGDEHRTLSEKEMDAMLSLYRRSVREGAWGMSVGLEYSHEQSADVDELTKLLTYTAKRDGLASFHLRDEGDEIATALTEVLSLVRSTSVQTKISHFKVTSETEDGNIERLLSAIDATAQEGLQVWFDIYPYTTTATVLYLLLPEWAARGGKKALFDRLTSTQQREKIMSELQTYNYAYDNIRVAMGAGAQSILGKSIAELAANQDRSPEEIILDLLVAGEDHTVVFINHDNEAVLERLMVHPHALIATDGFGWNTTDQTTLGLVHPRCFSTTARVFERYVRERKTLSLERAVHKMSGLPARILGLKNRGTLATHNWADIVIFNPDTIRERSTFTAPYQYPDGIPYVIINGTLAVDDGNYTGKHAGSILRK